MKKLTLAALIALCSTPVLAQQGGFSGPGAQQTQTTVSQQGGFSGPSAALTTVDKVKSMSDDTWVMLQGNIEQRVGDDTYTFRDASGTLTVEIDNKRWNGQTITPARQSSVGRESGQRLEQRRSRREKPEENTVIVAAGGG
ncbi:Uncharacterized conserved protein [Serratia odorifera]|uniref:Uncharacterized conserved protein n=2 Tax=Enterobacterales TaxID=91347 RepID=A0A447KTZ0_SEROD|nr:YgiW/YdeI family stress tolerance OB fold protein [Serratia odorifera]VDZ59823.1 Uncharacterized conserved protein [Serratia odorifera]